MYICPDARLATCTFCRLQIPPATAQICSLLFTPHTRSYQRPAGSLGTGAALSQYAPPACAGIRRGALGRRCSGPVSIVHVVRTGFFVDAGEEHRRRALRRRLEEAPRQHRAHGRREEALEHRCPDQSRVTGPRVDAGVFSAGAAWRASCDATASVRRSGEYLSSWIAEMQSRSGQMPISGTCHTWQAGEAATAQVRLVRPARGVMTWHA